MENNRIENNRIENKNNNLKWLVVGGAAIAAVVAGIFLKGKKKKE